MGQIDTKIRQILDTDDSEGISFAELCQEMRKLVRKQDSLSIQIGIIGQL